MNPSWQQPYISKKQITNLLHPHFKSTERRFFILPKISSSKNSSGLFEAYLDVECCKTQAKFQYFKAAFMMTPWIHTTCTHRHLNPKDTTFAHRWDSTLWHKHSSSLKCLYWILRAKVSPTRSLCLPLHKATVLSCIWRSKSILNCGTLFHGSEDGCRSIFKGVLSIIAASMSTLQGTERNIFKS